MAILWGWRFVWIFFFFYFFFGGGGGGVTSNFDNFMGIFFFKSTAVICVLWSNLP